MISKIMIEILKLKSYTKRMGIKGLCQRLCAFGKQTDDMSGNNDAVWRKKHPHPWQKKPCHGVWTMTQDYVMICAQNIRLTVDAVGKIKKTMSCHPEVDMIYSDHEEYLETHQWYPCFKPDYSLAYLRSVNYIGCMVVVRKSLLETIRKEVPDILNRDIYELLLRISEKTNRIVHIPEILYQCKQSQSASCEKMLEAHFKRLNIMASVTHSVRTGICCVHYAVKNEPLVSVIIPNKDHRTDLKRCIASLQKQTYKHFEIIIIENNSHENEIFEYYKKLQKSDMCVRILTWQKEFNYSALNNMAVREAKGEYVLLLNNDVALTDECMLEKMLGQIQQPQVGIVGAKLLYADESIQHAGVIVGYEGVALHWFQGQKPEEHSYMNRSEATQDLSAVTAACMLVPKAVYMQAGGMDEQLAVAYNDIDFCLAVKQLGYHVIYDADATGLHDESKSRGTENTVQKMKRFNQEVDRFHRKWKHYFKLGDPFYNPNLSLSRWDSKYKI